MKVFGIVKPDGELLTKTSFFTNRPAAVNYLMGDYGKLDTESRRYGKDGSDLDWKCLKRQGWKISPVSFVL
jgi:hypothetical protein